MASFVIEQQPLLISLAFFGALLVVALWESFSQFRATQQPLIFRWGNNFALGFIGSVLNSWLLAAMGLGAALLSARTNGGLLALLPLPGFLVIVTSVLLLDLVYYWLHRLWHWVPLMWRFHRVHHSDTELDFSVTFRHHPIENIGNILILVPFIYSLGIPPAAYILFSVIRSVTQIFGHANITLPRQVDRCLRWLFITPDMHRIHHSSMKSETDSNFSDGLTWWDHLFGTYCAKPLHSPQSMELGLKEFRDPADNWLHNLLLSPLRR